MSMSIDIYIYIYIDDVAIILLLTQTIQELYMYVRACYTILTYIYYRRMRMDI